MNWSQYNEAYSRVKFINKENKCELSLCYTPSASRQHQAERLIKLNVPRLIIYLNEPPKFLLEPPPRLPLNLNNYTLNCLNNAKLQTKTTTNNSNYLISNNTNTLDNSNSLNILFILLISCILIVILLLIFIGFYLYLTKRTHNLKTKTFSNTTNNFDSSSSHCKFPIYKDQLDLRRNVALELQFSNNTKSSSISTSTSSYDCFVNKATSNRMMHDYDNAHLKPLLEQSTIYSPTTSTTSHYHKLYLSNNQKQPLIMDNSYNTATNDSFLLTNTYNPHTNEIIPILINCSSLKTAKILHQRSKHMQQSQQQDTKSLNYYEPINDDNQNESYYETLNDNLTLYTRKYLNKR